MNVFYTSYIYKPTTSSHTKPGLPASYWFVNLPIQEIFVHRDFRTQPPTDSRISQTPNFVVLQVHDFGFSRVRYFEASQVRDSRSSHIRDFGAS
jgi:hypothetical protein